jgi:hypothetical protein
MFSTVLKEVTGVLSRRFIMTVFFPSLIFWGLLIVLIVSTQVGILPAAEKWNEQDSLLKTLQIIGLIAWVTFFANMVLNQLPAILRFYEGYWNFPLGRYFKAIGKKRHQKHLQQLTEKYLFSWNEIPGNDNKRLIGFLKKRFDIVWADNAEIEKIENGRTIRIYFENNYLTLELNDGETKAILKIGNVRTDEFIAKKENDKLNIY